MRRDSAMAPPLWRARYLEDFTIGAKDGDIGRVEDLYFDDRAWTIRYLVVETGPWLHGRRVFVAPASIDDVDADALRFRTSLTREQVRGAPTADTARPVSRQHEERLLTYYGLPFYWRADERGDIHLRSVDTVREFRIHATDGDVGHVVDFLVDEEAWVVRYLEVDPRSWWPGPHVLLAVEWITSVGWEDAKVHVNVGREAVRRAPRYETAGVDRDYEARLHAHYGRRGYWERSREPWTLR